MTPKVVPANEAAMFCDPVLAVMSARFDDSAKDWWIAARDAEAASQLCAGDGPTRDPTTRRVGAHGARIQQEQVLKSNTNTNEQHTKGLKKGASVGSTRHPRNKCSRTTNVAQMIMVR